MGLNLAKKAADHGYEAYLISNDINARRESSKNFHLFLIKGLGDLKTYILNTPKILKYLIDIDPNVLHVHGGVFIIYIWLINLIFRKALIFSFCEDLTSINGIQKKIFLFCLFRLKHIFVTSRYLEEQLIEAGVSESNIQISRLGLNEYFLKSHPIKKSTSDIFFFGDASKSRGFDLVYALAAKLPKLSFAILIRWEKDCVTELNKIRKLANVQVYRPLYNETLTNMILKSKIILLPFRWMGVRPPLSIVESMALGKCVITSTMKGNEEIISNNRNGLMYNFENVIEISKKIQHLVNHPIEIKRLGIKAKQTIKSMYSDNEYIKIINYYGTVKTDK